MDYNMNKRTFKKFMSFLIGFAWLTTCISVSSCSEFNVGEYELTGDISEFIIRKTKCFRIWERNAIISKTKRNFSRLYPTPQNFKKIDRLRRNEIHLKAVRTSS